MWRLDGFFFLFQVTLIDKDDGFKLAMMKAAKNFDLPTLLVLCERALIASVSIKNCIKLYTTAEEIGAKELQDHCSQLISSHWVRITNWKKNTKKLSPKVLSKTNSEFSRIFLSTKNLLSLFVYGFFSSKEFDWLKIKKCLISCAFSSTSPNWTKIAI